jgi:predicted ATPase
LQWVDVPSLSIIDFIISDAQNSCPLLLIGCYRSNEIDNYHIVSKKRRTFAEKKIKYEFNITDIDLGDFNLVEVNQMIKSMLSIEEDQQIRGLANICFKRTLGNPFFLIEFMAMLEEDGLIEYNLGLLKWIWDDKKIVKATTSTANVTDLLQGRMQRLPENAQLLLQFASNLGSVFSLSTLNLIWERHMSSNTLRKLTSMHALLEFLEEKDFIEKCGINIYRWVHDRVQESALALGAGNDPDFQFEMGSILYHSLEKCQLDDALFDIVNLVNKRMIKRRLEFAELNLRAAEKARNISAFHTSAKYASSGILQLTRDAWETNASLALRLHTLGAEMELAVGQIVEMETYTERVLAEKSLSILERMPIYTAWSHKLQLERQYGDSVKFCLSVLKELGCNLVKVGRLLPVQVLSSFRRTVNRAKSTPQKVYRSKKRLTAKKLAAIMRFLQRLAYASYLSNSNLLMILAITRQIQITLTYGVGDSSASAFAYLGLLTTSILKDYQSAAYFGEIALLLQRSIESKYIESITVFVTYYACLPWTKPLQLSLEPFLLSYTSGMRSGYTEYSMVS